MRPVIHPVCPGRRKMPEFFAQARLTCSFVMRLILTKEMRVSTAPTATSAEAYRPELQCQVALKGLDVERICTRRFVIGNGKVQAVEHYCC
jgi:hypothetical protein